MPGSRAGDELAFADHQGIEDQQPLVILGYAPQQVSQEVESMGVLFQALDRGWCSVAAATKHGRVNAEVRNQRLACGRRHDQTGLLMAAKRILRRPGRSAARAG